MKFYNLIVITDKYSGKTVYDFWKNLEVNDTIVIRYILEDCGKYKPTLKIMNMRNKGVSYLSPAELINRLNKLKYNEATISSIDIFNFESN